MPPLPVGEGGGEGNRSVCGWHVDLQWPRSVGRIGRGRPAAPYFLCSCKESRQRKHAPLRRPSGSQFFQARPGGCATRPAGSNSARRLPPNGLGKIGDSEGKVCFAWLGVDVDTDLTGCVRLSGCLQSPLSGHSSERRFKGKYHDWSSHSAKPRIANSGSTSDARTQTSVMSRLRRWLGPLGPFLDTLTYPRLFATQESSLAGNVDQQPRAPGSKQALADSVTETWNRFHDPHGTLPVSMHDAVNNRSEIQRALCLF